MGFACLLPIARDQARLKFRYVRNDTTGVNGKTSPQSVVAKGKMREDLNGIVSTGTPTPSMNSSKVSLPLSQGSGEDGDAGGGKAVGQVVVELILMNPKCKSFFSSLAELLLVCWMPEPLGSGICFFTEHYPLRHSHSTIVLSLMGISLTPFQMQ